jgi:hypothetical protein
LMAALIYGGGLRASECCALRVKDLDFDRGLTFVRSGKGNKDRSTLLAEGCHSALRSHLQITERLHRADRNASLAGVWLPDAIERKYPSAGRELGWFCSVSTAEFGGETPRWNATSPKERGRCLHGACDPRETPAGYPNRPVT